MGREPEPDEPTVCKFRHLLEAHNLGDQLFTLIADYLQENGLKISTVTIVDATIIDAPSSTKNRTKSKVRAKAEHPFLEIKRIFSFNKVRYRGLDKNANRVFVACGLANLYMDEGCCCDPHRESV